MKIINITDPNDKLFNEFYKDSSLTLEGLDLDSLGGRWFDDVVDNILRRW